MVSQALTPESGVEKPTTVNLYVRTEHVQQNLLSKKGNRSCAEGGSGRSSDAGDWQEGKREKPGVQGEVFSRGLWFVSSVNVLMQGKQTVPRTSSV